MLVDMEDVTIRHDHVHAVVGLTETSSTDLRALRKEVPGGSAGGEVAERRIVLYVGGDNTDGAEAGASLSVADSDDAAVSYMLNISDTTEGTMKRPPPLEAHSCSEESPRGHIRTIPDPEHSTAKLSRC